MKKMKFVTYRSDLEIRDTQLRQLTIEKPLTRGLRLLGEMRLEARVRPGRALEFFNACGLVHGHYTRRA